MYMRVPMRAWVFQYATYRRYAVYFFVGEVHIRMCYQRHTWKLVVRLFNSFTPKDVRLLISSLEILLLRELQNPRMYFALVSVGSSGSVFEVVECFSLISDDSCFLIPCNFTF